MGRLLGSFIGAIMATLFIAGAAVGRCGRRLAAGALAGAALGAGAGAIEASWSREDACIDGAFVRDAGARLPARRFGDLCADRRVAILASSRNKSADTAEQHVGRRSRRSSRPRSRRYLRDRSAA